MTSIPKEFSLLSKYPVLLLLCFVLGSCQNFKSLPNGVSYAGSHQPASDLEFLSDSTWVDLHGVRHVNQEIFDEIFGIVANARRLILLDMFLYNDFQGEVPESTRALSSELTGALIRQKQRFPDIRIIVITDEINSVYGGKKSIQQAELEAAGIDVVTTDLEKLRDSNAFYSFFWRLLIKPFGNSEAETISNPIGEGKISIRSFLRLLNFKANHRKVVIADSGDKFVGLVTSANPHDGSSAHRNTAVRFSGPAVQDLLQTEKAVLDFSGTELILTPLNIRAETADSTVQILTEKKIKEALLENLRQASKGDSIDLMMFYLSDRDIVSLLKHAHKRGSSLRVILDPNKDAFGLEKNGIPNRQVAIELRNAGVPVRWCSTHGEQCHAKMITYHYQNGASVLILGSANFTRRNLEDYNLETDVLIQAHSDHRVISESSDYFEQSWANSNNRQFTVDFAAYRDNSFFRKLLYRFMEFSGFSTF